MSKIATKKSFFELIRKGTLALAAMSCAFLLSSCSVTGLSPKGTDSMHYRLDREQGDIWQTAGTQQPGDLISL